MAAIRIEMKFVLILALLVYTKCTSTQKNNCSTPGNPININVHGTEGVKGEKGEKGDLGASRSCKCDSQDSNKPSAHIEAMNKQAVTYQANKVIKDWSASAPHSHLAGAMKYSDGKLTVPTPGRYFVYAQIYYYNNGRTEIRVNNKVVTMITPPVKGAKSDEGAIYVGGVFNLKGGDVITLNAASWPIGSAKIYMYSVHTYFGAYLI